MVYYIGTDNIINLSHHGVQGQKWGVRRYQNPDGTLTALGRKRLQKDMASDKKAVIQKGETFYRISDKATSDTGSHKIYVNKTSEANDFYAQSFAKKALLSKGKAYTHEYIAKHDIVLPDKKTTEKVEMKLLNDPRVRDELIESYMKKGLNREMATSMVKQYSLGRAFLDKVATTSVSTIWGASTGAMGGLYTTFHPIGIAAGAGVGAVIGAGLGLASPSLEKERVLTTVRAAYGDKNNTTTNKILAENLKNLGYNGVKDYNDRRAFGKNGKQAAIIFDSDKNLKLSKSKEIKAKDYGEMYARNYIKQHPDTELRYQDLVNDGMKKYKVAYETGVIQRARAAENKKILEEDKRKTG